MGSEEYGRSIARGTREAGDCRYAMRWAIGTLPED